LLCVPACSDDTDAIWGISFCWRTNPFAEGCSSWGSVLSCRSDAAAELCHIACSFSPDAGALLSPSAAADSVRSSAPTSSHGFSVRTVRGSFMRIKLLCTAALPSLLNRRPLIVQLASMF
jgi:hypothetical protein